MAVNAPIWMDTSYSIAASASPFTYNINLKTGRQIIVNGNTQDEVVTVFSGKAWIRPDDATLKININKIAQNYLYSDLPDLRNVSANTSYENKYEYRQFYLTNSANTTLETYNFLMDWSYDTTALTSTMNMSRPINLHGATNMLFLSTEFNSSSQKVVTTLKISGSSSYDRTHCGSHAIYYLNRYGGWDSFLIEGNVVKTDKYKRYQTSRTFDNKTIDFQKKTYDNEITESYKLSTGWLTDSQSQVLAEHLLSTNMAYLHNLVTGEIIPINITDASTTYKTYKNNNRKRVNYTINVESSQTKSIIG